jgi:hypothetical protein
MTVYPLGVIYGGARANINIKWAVRTAVRWTATYEVGRGATHPFKLKRYLTLLCARREEGAVLGSGRSTGR